jgi:hypothetical protein
VARRIPGGRVARIIFIGEFSATDVVFAGRVEENRFTIRGRCCTFQVNL